MMKNDWHEYALKDVCLKVEKTNKTKYQPNDRFLYVDIASIDNDKSLIVAPKTYQWRDAPSRAQQILQEGDTVFSTVRTYLKNIALVEKDISGAIGSTGFCVIRPNPKLASARLIFYYTLTNQFLDPLNAIQRGTSYPAVRDGDVMAQKISLPSLEKQEEILQKIDELFSEIDSATDNIEQAFGKVPRNIDSLASSLRQAILKKAFDGELI